MINSIESIVAFTGSLSGFQDNACCAMGWMRQCEHLGIHEHHRRHHHQHQHHHHQSSPLPPLHGAILGSQWTDSKCTWVLGTANMSIMNMKSGTSPPKACLTSSTETQKVTNSISIHFMCLLQSWIPVLLAYIHISPSSSWILLMAPSFPQPLAPSPGASLSATMTWAKLRPVISNFINLKLGDGLLGFTWIYHMCLSYVEAY